ncbi:MAG TPA: endonuclease/exonuclease/phosphatase family protein [Candidatus Paceibacterota bacterium]|nr:endonuclease/exonuclease/phosphatase family protein [Candidatus Paceibacterota bacterium]
MKLLQWNIWNREDVENTLKLLREVDADILCLQELTAGDSESNNGADLPARIAAELGLNYVFAPASDEAGKKYGDGIFSRFPIISSVSSCIQDPPPREKEEDYSSECRVYVEASIQLEDDVLNVGTSHMSYTDRFGTTEAKIAETNKLLETLKQKKERFIFAGDLNATPDTYTVTEISKVLTHCGPNMSEKTWTTKPFAYKGFEETQLNWRLDYCFATPDITITSSKIIQTDYSDHLPVLIEF